MQNVTGGSTSLSTNILNSYSQWRDIFFYTKSNIQLKNCSYLSSNIYVVFVFPSLPLGYIPDYHSGMNFQTAFHLMGLESTALQIKILLYKAISVSNKRYKQISRWGRGRELCWNDGRIMTD